ncbi:MAG: ParB/RepB/Spo0J family partition protein [Lachnospiraceae bacterium oral taxon 082]|nr:ParB/RepB/Spo0J family partition protein [uncultured Lachnoanaerobaculum sp.]MBF1010973.1 ParB/RepB/Spo0J family partition protein [Lachnoanaerobaculum sp.]MBS6730024.1 ParB/RepB/Spo0J family partition protein [Lachnospiraceae bacterium oral taxon 082]
MAKRMALGKGADALLRNINGTNTAIDEAVDKNIDDNTNKKAGELMVKISLVEPNRNQPRKMFDKDSLDELTKSVKQYGVLQPIIVKKIGNRYEIVAGERRWRAAQAAGLAEVPVVVRDYDDQKAKEIAIIENIQRTDLNPIEEALAYKSLIEEYNLTQEELSDKVSKNRSTITNSLRLLKLSKNIQQYMIDGQISSGHARALLSLEDEGKRELLALDIMKRNLSVRDTEKAAKALSKKKNVELSDITETSKEDTVRDLSLFYKEYEDSIQGVLGTKVHINQKDKNKGRIEIEYYSQVELDRIMDIFKTLG